MRDKTPAEKHAAMTKATEIGATAGKTHADVLRQTLGDRPRHEPVVVGDEEETRQRARSLETTDVVNEEINDKKLARHGNIGDAARRDKQGRPALGEETA